MRISEVTDEAIIFDNGNKITFDHDQDCCESNYADFESAVTPNTLNYDYDFSPELLFGFVKEEGFLFGNPGHLIFVPCYSEQNGYYSIDIDIYYNGDQVLHGECHEEVY